MMYLCLLFLPSQIRGSGTQHLLRHTHIPHICIHHIMTTTTPLHSFGAGACTLEVRPVIWCTEYHSAVKYPHVTITPPPYICSLLLLHMSSCCCHTLHYGRGA
jgi:hypothetical protein